MHYASLSTLQLSSWATLNNVELRGIKVESDMVDEDGITKGGGLLATAEHSDSEPVLVVPHDLIISKQQVIDCARTDVRLRELLEALSNSELIQVGLHRLPRRVGAQRYVQNSMTDYFRVRRLHGECS